VKLNLEAAEGPLPGVNPAAFFARLSSCYAAAASDEKIVHLRLGPGELVMRFQSAALGARMLPPLLHLGPQLARVPVAAPPFRLTLSIFADARLPPAPWRKSDYDARGLIDGYNDARWHTILDPTRGVLRMLDRATGHGICYFPSADEALAQGFTTPLLSAVAGFLREKPLQIVHAGAVGTAAAGVLIGGPGGAGKSTTVAACLTAARGLQMAGDDLVLVELAPRPRVFSLLSTLKLEPAALCSVWPELVEGPATSLRPSETESLPRARRVLFADVAPLLPLSAIVIPAICGRPRSEVVSISPAEALRSLAPSTMQLLPEAGGAAFTKLAALVRALPCYRLVAGTDLTQLGDCLAALIGRLS
jgi:hypothetical protein